MLYTGQEGVDFSLITCRGPDSDDTKATTDSKDVGENGRGSGAERTTVMVAIGQDGEPLLSRGELPFSQLPTSESA
jgi:hypothetical protein